MEIRKQAAARDQGAIAHFLWSWEGKSAQVGAATSSPPPPRPAPPRPASAGNVGPSRAVAGAIINKKAGR
jgi:hypothetical protein